MRRTACCLLLFVAFTPAAEAKVSKLSMHRAKVSIAKIGNTDVRLGDATSYEVRDCRRRSRARIVCTLREYDVALPDELGGGTTPESVDWVAISRRGKRACLAYIDGQDACY